MQVTYTQISKKGLITIPRAMRDALGLSRAEQPLLKLTQLTGKVIVEPVNTINMGDIRIYSDEEIDNFIKEDKISGKERKNAQVYLKNLP